MIATTTISSMRVKPPSGRLAPILILRLLPVRVLRAVERDPAARRPDVEDVRAVPEVGVPVLLVRPEDPVGLSGHRIDRDPPKELQLPLLQLARVQPLHERLELRRVPLRIRLLEDA